MHNPAPSVRLILALLVAAAAGFAAAAPADREAEAAAAHLHARKAETLLTRYMPSQVRDAEIRRELDVMARRLDRAVADTPVLPLPGVSEEAYVSPIDGSAQPFFRYLPSAWRPGSTNALPLLVYLHGYAPTLDLINWALFPAGLTNFAEQVGACVAMPFGRSNTDFQGIGEQDVLAVVDLMRSRYGTDSNRVVLVGYSMGGMGAWTVGARFAERFNGLLIVSGRGDYATWHGLDLATLPLWEHALVDAHFLSGQAPRLAGMPILAFHGSADSLIRAEEAEATFRLLRPVNPEATLVMLPDSDHWIIDDVLAREDCQAWLRGVVTTARASRPAPAGWRPGEVPSRLQNAFLDPFLFVQAEPTLPDSVPRIEQHSREWLAFAKAEPQRRLEAALTPADLVRRNVFLFGEPETSPLMVRVLQSVGITATATTFEIRGRSVPRAERGLWLAVPSPFARERTIAVNCGLPWGEALSPNHRYDMLPDLLLYTAEPGRLGLNVPVAAARVGDDGQIVWYGE